MAVLNTGDIAPDQARAPFDIALGEILFFAHFAKSVTNNHGGIISPGRLEGKQPDLFISSWLLNFCRHGNLLAKR